jgi:hypothetical protein
VRFLKLLDRTDIRLGERRHSAATSLDDAIRFEAMVRDSHLHYWRPGMSFDQTCGRLLIGLAPTASMIELRLAELLNDLVASGSARCDVDVFNLHDIHSTPQTADYFSQTINITATPVAGYWQNGKLIELSQGSKATMMCLQRVGLTGSFESMLGRLCPQDPSLAY